jgi:hypothetical protein
MNAWELLAKIDHEMMMVDVDLMEWQGHLDMAALAGVGMPLELWTDDDPPRRITKDVLAQAAGKPVRVMLRKDGAWGQVGTGMIDSEGNFSADITEDVPELSLNTLRHFSLRRDLPAEPSAYETLVAMPGSGVVEIPRVAIPEPKTNLEGFINLDNHPFFKE